MKTQNIGLTFCFVLILSVVPLSCERDSLNKTHPISKERIQGSVQKGPFISGTSITLVELNSDLVQTGKNFNTQIYDNLGSFELKQIELSSQFVELKADGFYFNEMSNSTSSARLILYALSDLTDKNTLNVNLLSHLERERIFFLISEGLSFKDAKKQAQQEVLRIFSIEESDMQDSELLDISSEGEDHAILLAISLILQGYRTVAELSELLANISTDLKEDGELNNNSLGSALVNHGSLLQLSSIRENLERRFEETGLITELANFEKYVNHFLQNSEFEITSYIEYPEFSDYGENILFGNVSTVTRSQTYSMAANLPTGTQLTIKLSGGIWYFQISPDGPVNWDFSSYNFGAKSQTFTAIESGKACDLKIEFEITEGATTGDSILIEYFENMSDTATRTKMLTILQP